MRDLRADLSKILDKVGYNVIHVCRDLRFRCECYIERSGESGAGCPNCYGTGYKVNIIPIRTFRQSNKLPEAMSGINLHLAPGRMALVTYIYYFEHTATMKENDLIMEIEWVDDKPTKIKEKQEISAVDIKTGRNGRVEFYQVYTESAHKGRDDDAAIGKH